ncbi:hypothetical protein Acr_00g0043670 [Actinidia rufa]|uniref:Uncharacterized protein n=1 Tax=Actinidia rufa TaxID=165716 RepID=A0A7J0DIW0_9ERIC|nr:hypothetical protein Acr_00g0043670 [Actinidia rufa]
MVRTGVTPSVVTRCSAWSEMIVVPSVPFLCGVRKTQLSQGMEAAISRKQYQIWHVIACWSCLSYMSVVMLQRSAQFVQRCSVAVMLGGGVRLQMAWFFPRRFFK